MLLWENQKLAIMGYDNGQLATSCHAVHARPGFMVTKNRLLKLGFDSMSPEETKHPVMSASFLWHHDTYTWQQHI